MLCICSFSKKTKLQIKTVTLPTYDQPDTRNKGVNTTDMVAATEEPTI